MAFHKNAESFDVFQHGNTVNRPDCEIGIEFDLCALCVGRCPAAPAPLELAARRPPVHL